VEERLIGEEFTLQAFVDGRSVSGTPMVQDHKRAYEGDIGPNTGGMGSYSDAGFILPFVTEKDYFDGIKIMEDTVKAIRKETGVSYKGFLYGQFMATVDGVKVIEFNARLGDPEAMNILPLLDHDFLDVCQQISGGMLKGTLSFIKKATVCKYLVPEGYPTEPKKDAPIEVDEKKIEEIGGRLYYASVREEEEKIITGTSRAIAVVGIANTITEAEVVAEQSLEHVKGDLFHRKDIGTREIVQKRIDHMKELRGK
jgi:phosphoribosylamine--glycine ligase